PLFAIGITTQRMFTPEAGRDRVLLVRIVDRRLGLEEILQREGVRLHELPQGKRTDELGDAHCATFPASRMLSRKLSKNVNAASRSHIRPTSQTPFKTGCPFVLSDAL